MRSYVHSSVGIKHRACNIENQDACSVFRRAGIACGVLSDGMGSCLYAREAAEAAVDEGLLMAQGLLGEGGQEGVSFAAGVMEASFVSALKGVRSVAFSKGAHSSQCGCTLVAFALNEETGDLRWGSVGDSGLIALMEDGSVRAVTEPQKGPASRSQTYALDCAGKWRFGCMKGVAAVIAATDGVLDRLCFVAPGEGMQPTRLAGALFELACSCADEEGSQTLDEVLSNEAILAAKGPFAGVSDDKTLILFAREDACRLVAGSVRV